MAAIRSLLVTPTSSSAGELVYPQTLNVGGSGLVLFSATAGEVFAAALTGTNGIGILVDAQHASYAGNLIQLDTTAGTVFAVDQLGKITADNVTPVGAVMPYAGIVAPTGWLLGFGQAVSRSTYAALFAVLNPILGTATMTIASPAVVTLNSHGLVAGDAIFFTTTGALPTGVTAGTRYFVISTDLTANTFKFSATFFGGAVNTSGSQSGVHTLRRSPYGVGDGASTFNVPDFRGRALFGNDAMGGTAANRLTGQTGSMFGSVLGHSGGTETHQLQFAELPDHTSRGDLVNGGSESAVTGYNNLGNAHNNVPPGIILQVIIKT